MSKTDPYTRIFHEWLEPFLRLGINGHQCRIILWVARNSYGRQGAKQASFSWRGIAHDLGRLYSRSRISREGRALVGMGILKVKEDVIWIDKYRIRELTTGGADSPRGRIRPGGESDPQKGADSPPPLILIDKERRNGLLPSFEVFWSAYPKKRAKAAAMRAYQKIRPDAALLATLLAAIERQKASRDWQKEDGQFIPHATTWLNGQRWEDEVEMNSVETKDPLWDKRLKD